MVPKPSINVLLIARVCVCKYVNQEEINWMYWFYPLRRGDGLATHGWRGTRLNMSLKMQWEVFVIGSMR